MAFTITFGNGGNASATKIDSSFLDGSTETTTGAPSAGVGSVVDNSTISVAGSSSSVGNGGTVAVDFDADTNAFAFDVVGKWNSVKDVEVVGTTANIALSDFVHADVTLTGNGGSSVSVLNTKRGNITTGGGDDTVHLTLLTNDAGWQNTFAIKTGAGNDTIVIGNGTAMSGAKVADGSLTTVTIEGGAGNDSITLVGSKDTLVYNNANEGSDTIYNFNAGDDKVDLAAGVTVAAHMDFAGDLLVALSSNTQITFKGMAGHYGDIAFV